MTALAGDGSRSPLSDRGRRTRERLVVAARTVFEERGFDATRMSDIALAAGVSHGTVYTWFPTKEDVLHAAVDSVTEEMYEVLSTCLLYTSSCPRSSDTRLSSVGSLELLRADVAQTLQKQSFLLRTGSTPFSASSRLTYRFGRYSSGSTGLPL